MEQVRNGETATSDIQRLCFDPDGPLRREFDNLYAALFNHPEGHLKVVRALAKKWKGLTRTEIIRYTKLSNGGGLSKIIDDLTKPTFIISYRPFGRKTRETLYRLTDEYSLFYLTFIEGSSATADASLDLASRRKSPYGRDMLSKAYVSSI